MSSHFQ